MIPALSLLSYSQECPYGEWVSTMAFKILTYWYVCLFLWVLLARGRRLPGVACPCTFPAVIDLHPRALDSTDPVCCWIRDRVNGLGATCFLALEGAGEEWGVGGGRRLWGRKVTFTHIWLSYRVSLALQWIELPCVSCPSPLYSNVKSLGKSVF